MRLVPKVALISSGQPKGHFGSISADTFCRKSFCIGRKKIHTFGLSADRTLSAERASFCRKGLFLQKYASLLAERTINFGKIFLQFLQKEALSAESSSFGRNGLFRYFRYFCRKGLFSNGLFRLSAERAKSSFG